MFIDPERRDHQGEGISLRVLFRGEKILATQSMRCRGIVVLGVVLDPTHGSHWREDGRQMFSTMFESVLGLLEWGHRN